ncbi:MAG: hypothetical protein KME21_28470 [Desmonostoc vinosum HA7617-LM4]|jgi:hypothetical protein|nr:hypothetical protein [Desmonostoc vinosum HA7617-LM4]
MQLLDSLSNQVQTSAPDQLLDSLQDIVTNLQIQSSFCISHPAYKPLEIPAEVVARFQHIPFDLKNKYLSLQLQSFLYGIYYNGSLQTTLAPEADSVGPAPYQNLENNTFLGIDLEFYDRLHQSNSGKGYFDPGWSVVRQESDGVLAVNKGGLTLHVERKELADQSAMVGDSVAILMPRNLIQNGFYMAVSDMGLNTDDELVRIYFNLSPEGAVAVMASLTQQLNEIKIPFSFKVLYNPSDYKRHDSGVLYFAKSNYEVVRQVLTTVYAEQRSHFRMEVPLFTKQLAPGLALAEEPDQKFAASESFGMNRCQIIANGLLAAWLSGDDSPENRMASIRQNFSLLGIDLQRPYLNANSQDIYTVIRNS